MKKDRKQEDKDKDDKDKLPQNAKVKVHPPSPDLSPTQHKSDNIFASRN